MCPGTTRARTVEAIGQFSLLQPPRGGKNRLMLSVFVREIHFIEEFTDYTKTNQIFLDGYICKLPIYRKTPLGREIAESAPGGKPAIWKIRLHTLHKLGPECPVCGGLLRRDPVRIWGRVQSREYTKKLSDTECEKRVAYRGVHQQAGVRGRDFLSGNFIAASEETICNLRKTVLL